MSFLGERFWSKVDRSQFSPGGCWEWLAGKSNGYALFWSNGKTESAGRRDGKLTKASRLVFIDAGGVFTDEKPFACHRCNNPGCVNLAHIYAGSSKDNTADQIRAGTFMALLKTHCPQGHPLSEGNLLPGALKNGYRSCLTCNRRSQKTYKVKAGVFTGAGKGWQASKTHCNNGHPLSGSNLDKYQLRLGHRRCRTCKNNCMREKGGRR